MGLELGVYVYHADGRGGFTGGPVDSYSKNHELQSIALADVNRDGHPDIVINGAFFGWDKPNRPDVRLGEGRGGGLKSRLRPARVDGVPTPTKRSETDAVIGEQGRTPGPTDLIFPKWQRELFKTILDEENLRFDRDGRPRTAYSLRHTYICLRLMEGADIYQIAKNCRTSVEMIEKHYAAHIKTQLDAVATNIMRPKPKKKQNQPKTPNQSKRVAHEADV